MKDMIIGVCLFAVSIFSVSALAEHSSGHQDANLVIYRAMDASGINYRIVVDNSDMGKLKRKRVIRLNVEPGEYTITANDAKKSQFTAKVDEGAVTYVQASVDRKRRVNFAEAEALDLSAFKQIN